MAKRVTLLNGPNLNLLGRRQPEIYGHETLADVETACTALAAELGLEIAAFQSNHEGALVDRIQSAPTAGVGFIVINPAAYTHTSVAIRDALAAVEVPFIEVHLSNVHRREPFRHRSFLSDLATGVIAGLGASGYRFALQHGIETLKRQA